MSYQISTSLTWPETVADLRAAFKKWHVEECDIRRDTERSINSPVSVWFILRGRRVTMRLATQDRAVDNLRAIYLTIEGMRMAEVRNLAELTRDAYLQLEAPASLRDPYEVLGVRPDSPRSVIDASFRVLSKEAHPDAGGGSVEKFKQIKEAHERITR